MDTIFPWGYPLPTAFYLTLFVLTLVLHVLFMNYVLAGTAWLAWSILVRRAPLGAKSISQVSGQEASSESILADWIPTMLSGAITAGVAPLLFVQILYQREFYTANLLLFNRWMSILPVLIVGFYSLYVLRSQWLTRRSAWVKAWTGLLPFLCVAFVAYSWTENHLLSMNQPEQWKEFYAKGRQVYFEPQIVPRLAVWCLGSLSTTCVWLAWQLRYRLVHRMPVDPKSIRSLPKIALFGATASFLSGVVHYSTAPNVIRILMEPMARWYLLLAIVGMLLQIYGWIRLYRSTRPSTGDASNLPRGPLLYSTIGLVSTILGMSVCREVVRLSVLGESRMAELIPQHAEAMKVDRKSVV